MKRIFAIAIVISACLSMVQRAPAANIVFMTTDGHLPDVSWQDVAPQPVPEPTSLAVVLFGAFAALSRRRRAVTQTAADASPAATLDTAP